MFTLHHGCIGDDPRLGNAVLVPRALHIFPVTRPARRDIRAPNAVGMHRLTEFRIEIDGVVGISATVAPSAAIGRALHPAFDRMIVHHANILPDRSTSNSSCQVDLNAAFDARGKRKAEHPAVWCGGRFCPDAIFKQGNGVVTGRSRFALLRIKGAVPAFRVPQCSSEGLQGSGSGHDKAVTQVAVPADAAHLREGKTFYTGVLIAVTGTVVPAGDRIGADLHETERCRRTREGLAETAYVIMRSRGADKGIDIYRLPPGDSNDSCIGYQE